jgi:hypothetical protein
MVSDMAVVFGKKWSKSLFSTTTYGGILISGKVYYMIVLV